MDVFVAFLNQLMTGVPPCRLILIWFRVPAAPRQNRCQLEAESAGVASWKMCHLEICKVLCILMYVLCVQTNIDMLIFALKPCCGKGLDAGGYNFYYYLQLWRGLRLDVV
jgi:hypothetical protein